MTNSEINLAIAKALGLSVCENPDCFGCDAQAFMVLGMAMRTVAHGHQESLPWATSIDACFRDLIPEAESRGCTRQIQSISGHPGYAQAVFLLPESSGLTYNLSDHTIAPDEDDVDAEYARLEQRIRDAIDLVPRAICLAWLGSKRS